ncbi:flavin reductase family protein [Qaidamihabitans albus]|uniref:flavin reductase family protein n=1 Tax=Qaidamihabitans albus TaxID=2795733 RepID=UPI0018F2107D|nr:flavin reductase family protein [Qaidamihabitans albus]
MTAEILDRDALRTVFGACPSSVVAVCGMFSGERVGMAMSTFVPVSLSPPLVAVCVQHDSRTWPVLRQVPVLGLSVLEVNHESVARSLAGPIADRFSEIATSATGTAVHIDDSVAQMTCSIDNETVVGDHVLVVLRVRSAHSSVDPNPLVFHRSGFTGVASPSWRHSQRSPEPRATGDGFPASVHSGQEECS